MTETTNRTIVAGKDIGLIGPLQVEILPDGRRARLLQPFRVRLRELGERVIEVPQGFETDFASVPRFFWRVVPPWGRYSPAAVVHDYLYSTGKNVHYRPEKFDVLVYDPANGEIRMNARSKGEKQLYREKFGFHLFGSAKYFDGESRFSLEPLREAGAESLVCSDIDGMEKVTLKEIRFFRGGEFKEIEIR